MHFDVTLRQLLYHVVHLRHPIHPKMVFILSRHNPSSSDEAVSSHVAAVGLLYNHV